MSRALLGVFRPRVLIGIVGYRTGAARKITVPGLDGCWPKWSRMGQQSFRYLAPMVQERWFAVTVGWLGRPNGGAVAAALFWR